jgi:hypothetical protein
MSSLTQRPRRAQLTGAKAAAMVPALMLLLLLTPVLAAAGLRNPGVGTRPDPLRCGVGVSGQGAACQFRFHLSGEAGYDSDVLTVDVTLRDSFDLPVPDCSTSVTLAPVGPDSYNFCTCCGEIQTGFTDAMGIIQVSWDRIGGFGTLEVRVTSHGYGNVPIDTRQLDYTSSDLTGTCDENSTPVDIHDIALWARGLPPGEWIRSDWDCSGGPAAILDYAAFGSGLYDECSDGGPCP